MELHLNRYLDKDETVDHLDCNFLNNELSNFRVIKRSKHSREDVLRNVNTIVSCIWCNKDFIIPGNKNHYRNRKGKSSGFCSRSCSGKYGTEVQNKRIVKIYNTIEFRKEKYRQKSVTAGNSVNEHLNIGECLTVNTEA